MKKLITLSFLALAVSAQAQHHHHHRHGGNWIAPVIVGGVIGYALTITILSLFTTTAMFRHPQWLFSNPYVLPAHLGLKPNMQMELLLELEPANETLESLHQIH